MSNKAVMMFSAVGHAYFHMFTAFYFVIVLSLEVEWQRPYHELLDLWTLGALLVGAFAILAGWLGDRWSARGMLVVFFLGMGLSSVAAGFAQGPTGLLLALSGIGLFAAIYHPVGIPLVIRNSGANQGKALALNGVFGSLGAAMAGGITGFLADAGGSFLAFTLPGVVVALTGVAMLIGLRRARRNERAVDSAPASDDAPRNDRGNLSPLLILLFCFTAAGMIYHTTQTVMPKSFALGTGHGDDLKAVGSLVAAVYLIGGLFQFVGGAIADRYNLKRIYLIQFAMHGALLALAAHASGMMLVIVLCAAVALGASALPAENMLLARHAPRARHGVIFGMKFVLFFGTGPLGVVLVSAVSRHTGEFVWVFWLLSLLGVAICAAALGLPRKAPPLRARDADAASVMAQD